jgi:hypothetical protein
LPQRGGFFIIRSLLCLLLSVSVAAAAVDSNGWQRQQVNWRVTSRSRVKAIRYPADKPPTTLNQHRRNQARVRIKEITPSAATAAAGTVLAAVIDSPPTAGFVPWVVISVTDQDAGGDFDAYFSDSVIGNHLTVNPQSDYAVGIFDTGAGSDIISNNDAVKTGIYDAGMVTSLEVDLTGASGTATAYTSDPLGIFIAGLDILEPNGLLLDDSKMLGEYNVSLIVGDSVQSPNLPTAVGMPLAVYCSAAFCNNREFSATLDGNDFNSPYIRFYGLGDPCTPSYSNLIDLQLRPTDASAVQYFPCDLLGLCGDEPDGTPVYPSMIWGLLYNQSVYFLPWVNIADGNDSKDGLDGFMLDTGAQITVISRTLASGLHFDTNDPEFQAEIQDVTGKVTPEPGFYLDSLEIPADGQWLEYSNVPVVVLNVSSPEGGNLEGIIGTNLFVDLNYVIKGGGLQAQGYSPTLEFEPACHITGDIAPACGDCSVDSLDLAVIAEHWLQDPNSSDWYPQCDIAPEPAGDEKVNFLDFAALAENWYQSATP